MATRTRPATATGLLVALLLGALTACGPQSTTPAGNDDVPASSEPATSDEPAEEPSEEPSRSAEPSPEPGGRGTLAEALLPADQLPGFNETFTWQEHATGDQEPAELSGTCHQFELASIGAEKVAYRTYHSTAGDNSAASELVAEFPDEMTATRAFEVLKSWRDKCGSRLGKYERSSVGELTDVDADADASHWYLLTYGPAEGDPDAAYFDAAGLVRAGTRIAVLRLGLIGQDYNYEPGQEPMVEAVRAAAALL